MYKNCQEILEKKEMLEREKEEFIHALNGAKEAKKMNYIKGNRRYISDLIDQYKNEVNNLETEIVKCGEELIRYSTFPSSILIPFLKEVISIKEGNEYIDTKLVINESVGLGEIYVMNYTEYYLIFDSLFEEEEKRVENAFLASHKDFYYREVLKNSKYIMDRLTQEISLIHHEGLKYYFQSFPYLLEIAYNLIDRRLLEPTKPLHEILDDELSNIKSIGSKKIKVEDK